MKRYLNPDKELHKIREAMAREYYQLGPKKFLQQLKSESNQHPKELGLENRLCKLPVQKIR
ncbi:MAG: hypothetical protein HYS08_00910 [Chlamydiae bacterium]|nr:hypothetical protein [Chlamydiota bacterium]MBI3265650.1 hypothetical protein [Chlamydiota bacterium]